MPNHEVFDSYLAKGNRHYRPYYHSEPAATVRGDRIQLFRRSSNPNVPQVASSFRDILDVSHADVERIANNSTVPVHYGDTYKESRDTVLSLPEASHDLPGCIVPGIDRLQALYLKISGGISSWLSATHSPEVAEEMWRHRPLMELSVPLTHVMPATRLAEATVAELGARTIFELHETAVFGAIRDEWIVRIEKPKKILKV